MTIRIRCIRALIAAVGALAVGAALADIRQDITPGRFEVLPVVVRPEPERTNDRMAALTPEQRQQMRQQMREHWRQMPPERQEAVRQRWRNASPEERQQWRDERMQHWRQDGRQEWRDRGGGRGQERRGWR